MIKSDTPCNIKDLQIDDILNYVDDEVNGDLPSARVRLNYVKMLYDVLGYDLTPDAALAAVAEPQAELVLAVAGAGKTTWSQIKAVEQKFIRKVGTQKNKKLHGDQILCLVYNAQNVSDMQSKHSHMINRILAANIEGLRNLDDHINACTMHSFCEFFRKQFVAKLNYVNFRLAEESEAVALMQRALSVACKMHNYSADFIPSASKVHSLYTLTKERLQPLEELTDTDIFIDVDLPISLLNTVFERFDHIKVTSRKYEFIDMLYRVYELLKTDEAALKYVQRFYGYVIADEVQDFTPLMWELLQLFVSDGTPVTCIGDEDQTLYSFRGAQISDILQFTKRFPGGKVYTLSENRRCREVILDEARSVIETNRFRFDKEIVGCKPGGEIRTIPYNSKESQILRVVQELKKMSKKDQQNTVICYRAQDSSTLLVDMLQESGIQFNCLRANLPYSHELYRHMIEIFNALEMPFDRECFKNLWKVLPCKKGEFLASIGFDVKRNKFVTVDEKKHFALYHYGNLLSYNGFGETMLQLLEISKKMETAPLSEIFPIVYGLLCKYFWEYKRSLNDNEVYDDIFEEQVKKTFNVSSRYSKVYREIQRQIGICKSNTETKAGVTLSTFHSLKGLEFQHVFIIDMDNDIFPNFPLIEYRQSDSGVQEELKEAERRLWYVALTRAIDDVTIFYYESNPSVFVQDYFERKERKALETSSSIIGNNIEADFMEADFMDENPMEDFLEPVNDLNKTENMSDVSLMPMDCIPIQNTAMRSQYLGRLFDNL